MTERRPFAWARYGAADSGQRIRLLVSARKAVTSDPGSAPEVWPLYTNDGKDWVNAEHSALGIWATHQQGSTHLVHVPRSGDVHYPPNFGKACRELFNAQFAGNAAIRSPLDTLAEDTITKRLAVLSRTDELSIAVSHMLSLVRLMRSTRNPIGFNYDDLFWTIRNWTDPDRRTNAFYQWSASYFDIPRKPKDKDRGGRREERK